MIVTAQNKILGDVSIGRLIVNDTYNEFLGIVDTNWANALNWSLGIVPLSSHQVYISALCNYSGGISVKTITINPTGTFNCVGFSTTGLENNGTLSFTGTIQINGPYFVNRGTFICGPTSLLSLNGTIAIPGLTVQNMQLGNQNYTLLGDLKVLGTFGKGNGFFDLGANNFEVIGTTSIGSVGFTKNTAIGSTIFHDKVSTTLYNIIAAASGNPVFEFQNGIDMGGGVTNASNTVDCTFKFTVNNQVFNYYAGQRFQITNLIADGVSVVINDYNTLVTQSISYGYGLNIAGVVDGTNSASSITLNAVNAMSAVFVNPTNKPMPTAGVFIPFGSSYKNIGFVVPASGNIDPYFNLAYDNLFIWTGVNSTGARLTASFSMSINNNLSLARMGAFDMLNYNLTVHGVTSLGSTSTSAPFDASGSGSNILFIGVVNAIRGSFTVTGTPNIEFRSGITSDDNVNSANASKLGYSFGSANLKFTTNNQTWNFGNLWVTAQNAIIDNNIQLTVNGQYVGLSGSGGSLTISSINGLNSNSKLISMCNLKYLNGALPMTTGQFDITSNPNRYWYYFDTIYNSYPIKGMTYYDVEFGYITSPPGESVRSADGNIVILGSIEQLAVYPCLEMGNYNLQVNGTSTLQRLRKSGAGSLLFIGLCTMNNQFYSFTGNPTMEFRGGLTSNVSNGNFNFGNQPLKFLVNNQNLNFGGNASLNNDIQVGSGVTLINTTVTGNVLIVLGTLNGVDSTSIFDNRAIMEFRSINAIMSMGLFKADQAANTVNYNTTLTQNIRIPDDSNYRILTLTGNPSTKNVGGTGGTVNVRSTYTKNTGVTVVGTITNNP